MKICVRLSQNVVWLFVRVSCSAVVTPHNINYNNIGSWDTELTRPLNVQQRVRQGHLIPRISLRFAGVSSLQGRRSVNEDRIVLSQLTKNVLMLALFDGHSLPAAAEFAQLFLADCIKYWLSKKPMELGQVLSNSFHDCNNLMAHRFLFYTSGQQRLSGTTATVALLRNNVELVVASVGDSRALLCRQGSGIRLSTDDNPGNEGEQSRIDRCGGMVITNSLGMPVVNGRLGMTRSLGDLELKKFGVTASPHIYNIKVSHGRDSFCVIMSDGVSHVMSNNEVIEQISLCKDPTAAASYITELALQYGSEDNVSVIVLPFGSWGKYVCNDRKKTFPVARQRFITIT